MPISGDLPNTARIALVDDDLSMRKAIGRLLRSNGYECVTYDSGEAALADPELLRMDCLIADIHLGGINGFELCERVRALGRSIPHIFITAHIGANFPEYPSLTDQTILLIKPFDERDLVESIERCLSTRL
jgi:FixJ family two-component response regulator